MPADGTGKIDMSDNVSSLIQEHNVAMRARYNEVRSQFEQENDSETLYMCSTWFNAGMVLLERDDNSIWPLLNSFLKHGSPKASSLGLLIKILRDIYIGIHDETVLENGVVLRFDHPNNSSLKVSVFLQVRFVKFVFAHLDVAALQKFASIQGYRTTCLLCQRKFISSRVYLGERVQLPKGHPLRGIPDVTGC